MNIDRVRGLSKDELYLQYIKQHKPVILLDANVPVHMTPDWWVSQYGHLEVPVEMMTSSEQKIKLREYVELIRRRSKVGDTSRMPYLRNLHIHSWFPDVSQALNYPPQVFGPNFFKDEWNPDPKEFSFSEAWKHWAELFIAGPGVSFPFIHFDICHTHAYSVQTFGKKTFYLWPPSETANMYPGLGNRASISHILDPDQPDLAKFPKFALANGTKLELSAGEMLYIPPEWWHTTKSHELNLTIGGNFVNETVWNTFVPEYVEVRHRRRREGYNV